MFGRLKGNKARRMIVLPGVRIRSIYVHLWTPMSKLEYSMFSKTLKYHIL